MPVRPAETEPAQLRSPAIQTVFVTELLAVGVISGVPILEFSELRIRGDTQEKHVTLRVALPGRALDDAISKLVRLRGTIAAMATAREERAAN